MTTIFRKVNLRSTLVAGFGAAMGFAIPATIYILKDSYNSAWLLYVGCFIFLFAIAVHTLTESKKRNNSESTVTLVFISHLATIAGVIISVITSFILLSILTPGYLDAGSDTTKLINRPEHMVGGRNGGLGLSVYMAATIFNFSAGSFVGIIFPFAAKKNQARDTKDPAPLHNTGTA